MNQEIKDLIRLGQKYKWSSSKERRVLEEHGVNLVRTDFYSESPTVSDIDSSFEYAECGDLNSLSAPFDDSEIFDEELIKSYAASLVIHSLNFDPPVDGECGFYWNNTQFVGNDAATYYATIMKEKPKCVIEIGSGFSTHVAHQALSNLGGERRLICIDPEPRTDIESLDGLIFLRKPVQEVSVEEINYLLEPGDFIFYDGSHTLKTGSDTIYFYLKILPYLQKEIFVHAHDVRLPYPRNKKALLEARLYWGEPYLLMAHLHNKQRYQVLVANDLLRRRFPDLCRSMVYGRTGIGGVSLWMKIQGK